MLRKRNLSKTTTAPVPKPKTVVKHAFKVSDDLRTKLTRLGRARVAEVGEVIFRKGESSMGVFLIVTGRVALSTDDAPVRITRIGEAGSVIGVPATINNRPYSLTAEAATKAHLVHVDVSAFKEVLRTDSDLCYSVVSMLSEEIRALRVGEMLALNVRCV